MCQLTTDAVTPVRTAVPLPLIAPCGGQETGDQPCAGSDSSAPTRYVRVIIPLVPTAQKRAKSRAFRARDGKIRAMTYKDDSQALAEESIVAHLVRSKPAEQIQGAVELVVTAYMPIPESMSRRKREMAEANVIRHTKKPDLDNLVKQIKDCLTATGYWVDDRQVVRIVAEKRYGVVPRWEVEVRSAV